jgi:hypothetical protein
MIIGFICVVVFFMFFGVKITFHKKDNKQIKKSLDITNIVRIFKYKKAFKVRPSTKCITPTNGYREGATD